MRSEHHSFEATADMLDIESALYRDGMSNYLADGQQDY